MLSHHVPPYGMDIPIIAMFIPGVLCVHVIGEQTEKHPVNFLRSVKTRVSRLLSWVFLCGILQDLLHEFGNCHCIVWLVWLWYAICSCASMIYPYFHSAAGEMNCSFRGASVRHGDGPSFASLFRAGQVTTIRRSSLFKGLWLIYTYINCDLDIFERRIWPFYTFLVCGSAQHASTHAFTHAFTHVFPAVMPVVMVVIWLMIANQMLKLRMVSRGLSGCSRWSLSNISYRNNFEDSESPATQISSM